MNLIDLCAHIYLHWGRGLGEPAQGGLLHVLGPAWPPRPLGWRPRGPRTSGRGMAIWIAGLLDWIYYISWNGFVRSKKRYVCEYRTTFQITCYSEVGWSVNNSAQHISEKKRGSWGQGL